MVEGQFDAAGFVVLTRRLADLSQRELAELLGVSQSTIALLESGRRRAPVDLVGRALALAGLRLAVIDEEDHLVDPEPHDAVRDNAGRRFPAHLDPLPADIAPVNRLLRPRYDRAPAQAWFRRRPGRDAVRRSLTEQLPAHPTVSELEERAFLLRYGADWVERWKASRPGD